MLVEGKRARGPQRLIPRWGSPLTGLLFLLALAIPVRAEAVFETECLSIQMDDTGAVRGLLDRRRGMNHMASQQPAP
jgi:hypothetical protein